jgi:UPF0042 nucleotide-binding protein
VIDNLPVTLVSKVAELAGGHTDRYKKLVLVMQSYDTALEAEIVELRNRVESVQVIFLDASTQSLVQRYESTKRRHPGPGGGEGLLGAIETERGLYVSAKAAADLVIDTSELNPHELRDRLIRLFAVPEGDHGMKITVSSFGYKHGIPTDVDLVLDCRFIPNPYWEPELRSSTGLDREVADYVLDRDLTRRFLDHLTSLLEELLPAYAAEGRTYLGIAFGCTGGRHRSVAVAEEVARRLDAQGWAPGLRHRDIER